MVPKHKRIKLSNELESNSMNASSRYLSFRTADQTRTRASIVPQYTLHITNANVTDTLTFVDEDRQTDALIEYLLESQWNACRVSPLHNLKYDKLKLYASIVAESLASVADERDKYEVEITLAENLKLESRHSDSLQISILNTKEDKSKIVYNGFLMSWGLHATTHERGVTHLPLLLDSGNAKVIKVVRQILMQLFDCFITCLHFNQREILLFNTILANFIQSDSTKSVLFTYRVPFTTNKTHLDLTFSAKQIHSMWTSYFPNDMSMLNEQCSHKWQTLFRNHTLIAYDVDISRLELEELKYPSMNIKVNGKIQMKDLEVTRHFLKLLCEISVILKGSTPGLSSEY